VRIADYHEAEAGILAELSNTYRQSEVTVRSQVPIRFSRTRSFTCAMTPSSMRVARCASFSDIPAWVFSSSNIFEVGMNLLLEVNLRTTK
jgi:hypothetical protein